MEGSIWRAEARAEMAADEAAAIAGEEQLLGPARWIAEPLRDRVKAEALTHGPAIDVAMAGDHISVQFDDGAWLAFGDGPEGDGAEREEQ